MRIAASCVVAGGIALVVSLAMAREYTATARIVIEPPAGTDLRAAMAVSPIYLESLKTYEHFALSDSLFQKAIDQFGLRSLMGNRPIESLKKRALKVDTVRNTRVLEIAATLPDPSKAQALAHFIAEQTVEMNRTMVSDEDRDLIGGIERQQTDLKEHVAQLDREWARLLASEPTTDLEAALAGAAKIRSGLEEQVQNVELELADNAEREKHAQAGELSEIRKEAANAQARLAELRRQLQAMERESSARERVLAERMAHRDHSEAERKAAQTAMTAVETRLREARGEAGYRGERLRIIDPAIVPERPSSPNVPLNVMAALLVAAVLSVLYFTLELNYQDQRSRHRRSSFRAVGEE
jgi:uncharacterized protein involved in exopolysaccharide biosynthesis